VEGLWQGGFVPRANHTLAVPLLCFNASPGAEQTHPRVCEAARSTSQFISSQVQQLRSSSLPAR
jgi:hypothetical protein